MAKATGDNTSLMAKISGGEAVTQKEFSTVVKSFQSQIEAALPMHLKKNAEKYGRQALTLFSQNPELQKCSAISILSSLMTASALGLDLNPQLGQCYVIPYTTSKRVNGEFIKVKEAQFQIGYRGAIALAYRSGEIARIHADVVYSKDQFNYSKGLNPVLEHKESEDEDRGEITHVYTVANFTNGGYSFEVWPIKKVIAHAKKHSQSFYKDEYVNKRKTGNKIENTNSPWHNDFESMAKKTLVLSVWKYWPISTEAMLAVAQDSTIRSDEKAISNMHDERDVITIPIDRIEDVEEQETPIDTVTDPQPTPDDGLGF